MGKTFPFFYLLSLFLWLSAAPCWVAAQQGFLIPNGKRSIDIPFDYTNNFIVLTVMFNKMLPLKFILDTGAEHTILTKREVSDLLRVPYEREFRVAGTDLSEELVAFLARRVSFDVAEGVTAPQEDILVLKEDYFRFEEYAGLDIHGIMSVSLFSKYIIKINYKKAVITLYDRRYFTGLGDGYVEVPIDVTRNKIYYNTHLQVLPDSTAAVKLLLDTGASLPLLLFNDTHPLLHPPKNAIPSSIGMGLGGFVEGFAGRVFQFDLGPFAQKNAVAYFQSLDSFALRAQTNQRNGLVGNSILGRYIVALDYQNEKMWLKPTKAAFRPYEFDRSGIFLISVGEMHRRYMVQAVIARSPAAEADIRRGDEIIKVGILPSGLLSLDDVQRHLQRSAGKKIKLVIKRDGKRLKKTIELRELL